MQRPRNNGGCDLLRCVQAALDAELLPRIKAAMAPATDLEVMREALYCFFNAVESGNHEQRE